jgi:isopentenyldiphosphate isomerase
MSEGCIGIKRAVLRRAELELGVKDLKLEDLHVGSRILYKAASCENWGEFEMDYLVFAKKYVKITPSSEEVENTEYVPVE